jgi:transcriptional regulator with XRE-family HTH domain
VAKLDVRNLGDYIREQRSTAQISLRQLASQAGVSNPYLSQIERGLRKPSAEILQQIARALQISAEALYVQAGILEERYGDSDVPAAVRSDAHLAERQKQVLLDLYQAYRRENALQEEAATAAATTAAPASAPTAPVPIPEAPATPVTAASGSRATTATTKRRTATRKTAPTPTVRRAGSPPTHVT